MHINMIPARISSACVGGIVVSIAAFQAVDPGSIPGQRSVPTFCQGPEPWGTLPGASELVLVARLR